MNPEFYSQAWDILVEVGGASKDEYDKADFVRSFSDKDDRRTTREWRFCGKLGFGGKFYMRDSHRHDVSCYPEDRTPEREALIDTINERLKTLEKSYA